MKPKNSGITKFLTVCIAPVIAGMTSPSAEAATRTWDGGAATNVLNTATNWSDDLVPSAAGDVAQWNGTVTGPLSLTSTGAWTATGGNGGGTSIYVTSAQTDSLTISPTQNFGAGATIDVELGAGPVTISPTALMVFRGGNATITNESSNTLTFGASIGNWNNGGGAGRTVTFAGAGNTQIDGNFILGGAGNFDVVTKNGAGTLTFNGAQNGQGTQGNAIASLVISDGTVKFGNAAQLGSANVFGNYTSAITVNGILEWSSSANQTLTGIVSGGGEIKQTAGNLTLTAPNTFFGAATITGGTLIVGGTGSLECAITVNGASAKYLNNSTSASFQDIPLTLGTIGGTGTISGVTVADNAGATVANGNGSGSSGALTLDTLTFNGDGAVSVAEDGNTSTSGIVVNGTLSTTPASGTITVNASSSFWNSGVTYNLLSAGTFSAALPHFTLGTIGGVTGRQAPSLVSTASGIGLLISGDNPKWSGLDNTNWVVGTTGPNSNWRLITLNTPTDYIQGDVVLFDDSAAGATVTVAISAADVNPAVVNFNNSKPYIINGPFGIASGAVNKDGTGNVTISAPNSFNGGTTLNAGTITLAGAGTLGATTSALTITSGTLNLGGTTQTVGPVLISGEALVQNGTLTAPGLVATNPDGNTVISSGLDLGAGTLSKSGAGILTLSGITTYTGATTISEGTLALSGSGTLDTTSGITLSGGSLDLGGTTQSTNAINITTAAAIGDTISNGTIEAGSISINSTTGIAVVSANIAGATGVTRNGGGGTLSLTGTNTFSGPLNFAGNGTVTIDGGSNTGGGAVTYNSFGSTFTVNLGSYLTSGFTTSGLSEFRFLNLNAGTLESTGNIFANTLAVSININGGTLKSGNAEGISVFDYNNLVEIAASGATFDTTAGGITVGNNQNMFATGNVIIPTLNRPRLNGTAGGTITLMGGNTLTSGITNNGRLDIQDNSTWDINGIASSLNGLTGGGFVTSSTGSAVLTINSDSSHGYTGTIVGGGTVSITKLGTGTQTLSASLTNQGNTTVSAGTLEFTANSAATFS
ncbi:MAG: autotransporter-associated beta strand repeat-containing protein, partial [Verrucomicrobiota bacterium]